MKVISWNVNGIRAAHKKGFMDYLTDASPDVMCLQEVRSEVDQIDGDKRNPDGYHAYYFPAASRKGYSGVAIYSKVKPINVQYGFGVEEFDCEGRFLQADYHGYSVMSIYFPKGYSEKESRVQPEKIERLHYKLRFYRAVLDHCATLRKSGRELIISGDYNTAHTALDLARPNDNTATSGFLAVERALLDDMIGDGYTDSLRAVTNDGGLYSWWSQRQGARERNVGWRIDYHFVTPGIAQRITGARIDAHITGSDHAPVVVEVGE